MEGTHFYANQKISVPQSQTWVASLRFLYVWPDTVLAWVALLEEHLGCGLENYCHMKTNLSILDF